MEILKCNRITNHEYKFLIVVLYYKSFLISSVISDNVIFISDFPKLITKEETIFIKSVCAITEELVNLKSG